MEGVYKYTRNHLQSCCVSRRGRFKGGTLFDRCEPADSQRVEVERRVFTRQNFFRVKNWQQVKHLILGRGGFGGCIDKRRFICPRGKRLMCRAVNADVTLAEESPFESPARAASSALPTRWL